MTSTPLLFSPMTIRGLTLPHRLWVSPMCQYSALEGVVQYWHQVHLGALALGRPGLIIAEATSVVPEGRITPDDSGLWNDEQVQAWRPIIDFSHSQGTPMALQLAHAGRKASTSSPFKSDGSGVGVEQGGWETEAPSALAYGKLPRPHELSPTRIDTIVESFAAATRRAVNAGFDAIEVHAAHGYLLHEFLSPLSNLRDDSYGGSFEGRSRIVLEIVERVRSAMPESMPLFVRISATDWLEGGWDLEASIRISHQLAQRGVDLIDVSSGGLSPEQAIKLGPGYQMPFAEAISREVEVAVGAVGLITEASAAEQALQSGVANAVLMGREFLRDPRYAMRAAYELGVSLEWPGQYLRAQRV
ncbi:MAG TPA: oxidoreductase [Microbacteriaceae bacterium]|jgi:2,4-dienoyl-CoA reductase-like NADH-dependent reductase (Old Yellow Enzyme family)|nr:oxidoreductase [Microbacteriaceae bacterium]